MFKRGQIVNQVAVAAAALSSLVFSGCSKEQNSSPGGQPAPASVQRTGEDQLNLALVGLAPPDPARVNVFRHAGWKEADAERLASAVTLLEKTLPANDPRRPLLVSLNVLPLAPQASFEARFDIEKGLLELEEREARSIFGAFVTLGHECVHLAVDRERSASIALEIGSEVRAFRLQRDDIRRLDRLLQDAALPADVRDHFRAECSRELLETDVCEARYLVRLNLVDMLGIVQQLKDAYRERGAGNAAHQLEGRLEPGRVLVKLDPSETYVPGEVADYIASTELLVLSLENLGQENKNEFSKRAAHWKALANELDQLELRLGNRPSGRLPRLPSSAAED